MKKITILTIIQIVLFIFSLTNSSLSLANTPVKTISFITKDGLKLSGSLAKPNSISGKLPAVIFIHQGGSSKEEWNSLPLFQQVVDNQMAAELEQDGKRAFWAKEIYDMTGGDKKLEIVAGSSQHGVSVF